MVSAGCQRFGGAARFLCTRGRSRRFGEIVGRERSDGGPHDGRFGGSQSGRTFLIGREDLIRALEGIQTDEAFAYESRRRQKLIEDLEEVRRDLRSRYV